MATRVTIDEAQGRLAELMAAAVRGEEVIVGAEGMPPIRLVAGSSGPSEIDQRSAERQAAFGMYRHLVSNPDIDILDLKAQERWDERDERKFGPFARYAGDTLDGDGQSQA